MIGPAYTSRSRSRLLIEAARALADIGRFRMCARASGDVDGSVALHDLRLEFGTLDDDEEQVEICHVPPGNPNARHTITVSSSALSTHLAHGDSLGECVEPVADPIVVALCTEDPLATYAWTITNRNSSDLTIDWDLPEAGSNGTIEVPPGDYTLTTPADGVHTTLRISWLDEEGEQQTTSVTTPAERCNGDTDGDGVENGHDLCPGTESGQKVDESGCSCEQRGDCAEDADNDGVADSQDDCPGTGSGEEVDTNGCSCTQRGDCVADADGDGMPDDADACPGTPTGAPVDANGCACEQRDTDGDGVDDCADLCSDTLADSLIDSNGCGCSQLDDDGDGVDNCDDLCPASVPDEAVDLSGCPTHVGGCRRERRAV